MKPNITEQDLFNEGFEKLPIDFLIGWKDYILNSIRGAYGYYLQATIHIPKIDYWGGSQEMFTKILVHRYYDEEEPRRLEEFLREGESEQIYLGNIRNKEHLKQLLKDLGIND